MKRRLCCLMAMVLLMGCASAPTSHTAEQIPQMTDDQLIAEYQANFNQAVKSANNLQKLNAQNDGSLGGTVATLIVGAPAAARGKSSIQECEKLKIEMENRGLAVPGENQQHALQQREDIVQ